MAKHKHKHDARQRSLFGDDAGHRRSAHRAPSHQRAPGPEYMPGADAGPFPAAWGRHRGKLRAVKATDMRTRRTYWADARDGTPIVGSMWKHYRRPTKRKKAAKAKKTAARRKKRAAAAKPAPRKKSKSARAKKAAPRKRAKARKKSKQRRLMSPKAYVRRLKHKASLTIYRDVKRGKRFRTKTYKNPRRRRRGAHMATYTNPRRRRRHHHRRRRHNPGMVGGAVKSLVAAAIPGAAGGAVAAVLDSTLLSGKSMLIRIGAKVLLAGVGGTVLRKNPVRSAAFVGAMVGTAAYEGTIKAAGGMLAANRPAALKAAAGMAAEDEASLGLLQQELGNMGLLEEEGLSGMGEEPSLGDEYEGMGEEPNLGDEVEGIGEEYGD